MIVPRFSQILTTDNYRLSPVESRFIDQLSDGSLRKVGVSLERNQITTGIRLGKWNCIR
jgi:hypothetical protein